jgi:hypothetical protein
MTPAAILLTLHLASGAVETIALPLPEGATPDFACRVVTISALPAAYLNLERRDRIARIDCDGAS